MVTHRSWLITLSFVISASVAQAQQAAVSSVQTGSDIPAVWRTPAADIDFVKREVMIPMRDGISLHSVILEPRNLPSGAPIVLERTPYDANSFLAGNSPHLRDRLSPHDRSWPDNGYIFVIQDIRGKYESEGDFVMTRPPIGPLNPTSTDDTTDAYDTIDWLVKHLPESNGRVGMVGSSYDGWAVVMALLGPHPALKVAAPESPMIDGWMGDDWFHYGAFRQTNFDYFTEQMTARGKGDPVPRAGSDDYREFLTEGSAGDYAAAHGIDQLPWWRRLSAHPTYDGLWRDQALDRQLVLHPSAIPTLWLQGFWDQEDIYGAVHSFEALTRAGHAANNHLAIGPWYHSQINGVGRNVGPLNWDGDTAADFRRTVLVPFFGKYLKDEPAPPQSAVTIYDPAVRAWDHFSRWPIVENTALTPLYLQPRGAIAWSRSPGGQDTYVSDPAKPVPFEPLPVKFKDHATWFTWLVRDQRFVSSRPDVLSYQSPSLTHPMRLQGAPFADLFIKTSGSDLDVVVKIIDVYPPTDAGQPDLAGYELPISLDIFRGRYRTGFDRPSAIPSGKVTEYRFRLPTVDYTFLPGHRVMVQVQSSLFPLYDRNPQTYVANVFFAKATDYRPVKVEVEHGPQGNSAVLLPVVPIP